MDDSVKVIPQVRIKLKIGTIEKIQNLRLNPDLKEFKNKGIEKILTGNSMRKISHKEGAALFVISLISHLTFKSISIYYFDKNLKLFLK